MIVVQLHANFIPVVFVPDKTQVAAQANVKGATSKKTYHTKHVWGALQMDNRAGS
jgi:hypothetical protein